MCRELTLRHFFHPSTGFGFSYQLETLVSEEEFEENFYDNHENNEIFAKIAWCVAEHQRAIKFVHFS